MRAPMKARSSRATIASRRNEGAKKRYRPCKDSENIWCANREILRNEANSEGEEVMKMRAEMTVGKELINGDPITPRQGDRASA